MTKGRVALPEREVAEQIEPKSAFIPPLTRYRQRPKGWEVNTVEVADGVLPFFHRNNR
jgi:hypothetical protein